MTENCRSLPDRSTCAGCEDEVDRLRAALEKLADPDLASWMAQPAYGAWVRKNAREALNGRRHVMHVIEHSGPICHRCGVEYYAEYEGPCQEPGCGGVVSWAATVDRLVAQLRGAVEDWKRVLDLAYWSQRDRDEPDKVIACSTEMQQIALRHAGGQ